MRNHNAYVCVAYRIHVSMRYYNYILMQIRVAIRVVIHSSIVSRFDVTLVR